LEKVINHQSGDAKKKKEVKPTPPQLTTVLYICLSCEKEEEIFYQVVRNFDRQNFLFGDESVSPKFSCENCGRAMYPRYYKEIHGFEYRILDVLDTRRLR
jgi:hypothetical protein